MEQEIITNIIVPSHLIEAISFAKLMHTSNVRLFHSVTLILSTVSVITLVESPTRRESER